MKYRYKGTPNTVVEATQWFKHNDHPAVRPIYTHGPDDEHWRPTVPTAKGWIDLVEDHIVVSPGDWVVTNSNGEHSVYRPNNFEATFEPVEPEGWKAASDAFDTAYENWKNDEVKIIGRIPAISTTPINTVPMAHSMTLRDHFAGLAMVGWLNHSNYTEISDKKAAAWAYATADAMMEARGSK